jgi:hypothetical protein
MGVKSNNKIHDYVNIHKRLVDTMGDMWIMFLCFMCLNMVG